LHRPSRKKRNGSRKYFLFFSCSELYFGIINHSSANFLAAAQTIKNNTTMKNPIRSLILGIALVGAGAGNSSAATSTYNASPSLTHNTNTTFSFTMFDSSLGTLTAVDLLLTSATLGGSVSLQSDGGDNILNSFNASVRTSGTGLSQQNSTTAVVTSFTPGPGTTVFDEDTTVFSIISSPQIISSTQTYSIGSGSFSSYQNLGGTGLTPNFTSQVRTPSPQGIVGAAGTGIFSGSSLTALSSYTLRYTYSTDPSPVPEPGQVAASLLLLGGIGGYVFVKRRRAATPVSA
jgi:hypothetical protein